MKSQSADAASYPAWRDRLAKANNPEFWPIEAIDQELNKDRAQWWATADAALVTRAVFYPGGAKALEALAAAGDMDALVDVIKPRVAEWAREHGYTHLLIPGRLGWARVHRDFTHYQTILLKDLRADG